MQKYCASWIFRKHPTQVTRGHVISWPSYDNKKDKKMTATARLFTVLAVFFVFSFEHFLCRATESEVGRPKHVGLKSVFF